MIVNIFQDEMYIYQISAFEIVRQKEGGREKPSKQLLKDRLFFSAKYRHPEFAGVAGHRM
jgi:hypothetical protein